MDSIGHISLVSDIGDYYESLLRKYKFGWIWTKISGTLQEGQSMFSWCW